ncbi:DUF4190 domain-containing protein [Aeromicrobium alkaliterrae]|uniref:DUF4190 domain-containing protein n=1 Tax=Aeromicrobium alkaliterrae TaxID=302168 RepID=A0ABP4VNG4_9ACTN
MSTPDPEQPTSSEPPAQPNPYAGQYPPQQPYPPQRGYYPPQQPYGYPQPMYPYYAAAPTNQKAIWAMVLGIVSIFGAACFYVGGFLMGIPAIILGVMARKEVARSQGRQEGGGFAVAGLVTGIIGLVINLLIVALFIVLFATDGFGSSDWYY